MRVLRKIFAWHNHRVLQKSHAAKVCYLFVLRITTFAIVVNPVVPGIMVLQLISVYFGRPLCEVCWEIGNFVTKLPSTL